MGAKWFYSDDHSPDKILVDSFKDSKFSMDKWNSFAREIVQNSIDARADYSKPVKVVFDLNTSLTIDDIPGASEIKKILYKCKDVVTNKQTKGSYNRGIEILEKDYIYCLKVSDYNTNGVKSGREEAWGAFIFDEGKSIKQRPGSAGSHGVGKKVPFIISTCNTVFYATKNSYTVDGNQYSDCLVQGKNQLTNWWDDLGVKKSYKGWFGIVNDDPDVSPENKIEPISNSFDELNPYFVRTEEFGTDVIIVGANVYDNEDDVKKRIINAVITNFYIAILNDDLEVQVFDTLINQSNFKNVCDNYYETENSKKNLLSDSLEALGEEPIIIPISDKQGNELGHAELYFKLGNSQNTKYFTTIRSHGMKISDMRVNAAEQPFTAVLIVKGEKLNSMLSELENAAHDEFITKDDDIEIPKECIDAYNTLMDAAKEIIRMNTKIDASEPQEIEGLNSILSIPGTFAVLQKKQSSPTIKHNMIKKKTPGKKRKKSSDDPKPIDEKKKKKKEKKQHREDGFIKKAYTDYAVEPFFVKNKKGYMLTLKTNDNLEKASIKIYSVNSDDKPDNSIDRFVKNVFIDSKKHKLQNGTIKNLSLTKGKLYKIELNVEENIVYQLKASISYEEVLVNE